MGYLFTMIAKGSQPGIRVGNCAQTLNLELNQIYKKKLGFINLSV